MLILACARICRTSVRASVCVCVCSPADVIYGNIPQLLIHGGLALLARMAAEGGLGMFVRHVDLYLTAPLGKLHFVRKKPKQNKPCHSWTDWSVLGALSLPGVH